MHLLRRIAILVAATVLVLGPTAPAGAVGAQGVDLTPLLGRVDGTLTAVVEEDTVIRVRLTNTTEEPRTVSVWVAGAVEAVGGGTGIGGRLDWITVDAPERIDLAPLEERDLEASVDLASYLEQTPDRVLFMLEVQGGGNVVPRAATIVALTDGGASIPLPIALLIGATLLLGLVAAAWWRFGRPLQRNGDDPTPAHHDSDTTTNEDAAPTDTSSRPHAGGTVPAPPSLTSVG